MKKLERVLFIGVLLTCIFITVQHCAGQNNNTFKAAVSVNADSTVVRTLQGSDSTKAYLYYNVQGNGLTRLDKWRVWEDGSWHDLLGGGGGSTFTNTAAVNELPASVSSTAIGPSGLFETTPGSLNMGSSSINGSRTISVVSSSASASLTLTPKGASGQLIGSINSGAVTTTLSTSGFAISNLTAARVPFVSTAGLLVDDPGLLYGSNTLVVGATNGTISVNGATGLATALLIGPTQITRQDKSGNLIISAGTATNTFPSISINASNAASGNNNGGDINLNTGTLSGSGRPGVIIISNIPTSASGLPTGALWSNAGILTIVP